MTNTTTKTAPERIWLQVDCDATISADGAIDGQDEPFSDDGVSWCSISVGGLEIEYIRADLVDNALGSLTECPCCMERKECTHDCTFAEDCPDDCEQMEYFRSALAALRL